MYITYLYIREHVFLPKRYFYVLTDLAEPTTTQVLQPVSRGVYARLRIRRGPKGNRNKTREPPCTSEARFA